MNYNLLVLIWKNHWQMFNLEKQKILVAQSTPDLPGTVQIGLITFY